MIVTTTTAIDGRSVVEYTGVVTGRRSWGPTSFGTSSPGCAI